jgi:hypothetical protein
MNTTVTTGARRSPGQAAAPPQPGARRPPRPSRPTRPGARVAADPAGRGPGPAARVAGPANRARTASRGAVRTAPPRPAPPRPAPPRPAPHRPPQARPAGPAGPASARRAGRRPGSRTPFILLLVGLLGGGMLCLLVINTTLAAASFRINALQRSNAQAAQRVQTLQQQVSTEQSPSSIEQRALRLGLRMQPALDFLDLRDGRDYTTPAEAPGASGYTP